MSYMKSEFAAEVVRTVLFPEYDGSPEICTALHIPGIRGNNFSVHLLPYLSDTEKKIPVYPSDKYRHRDKKSLNALLYGVPAESFH